MVLSASRQGDDCAISILGSAASQKVDFHDVALIVEELLHHAQVLGDDGAAPDRGNDGQRQVGCRR